MQMYSMEDEDCCLARVKFLILLYLILAFVRNYSATYWGQFLITCSCFNSVPISDPVLTISWWYYMLKISCSSTRLFQLRRWMAVLNIQLFKNYSEIYLLNAVIVTCTKCRKVDQLFVTFQKWGTECFIIAISIKGRMAADSEEEC